LNLARGVGRALRVLHQLEDATLAVFLGVLIVLASLQIALRNFFDTSIPWGGPLLRVLVLWTGLIGAVVASRDHRQISIDAVSRLLSGRARLAVRVLTSAFAAAVSALIGYHATRFVATEFAYESGVTAGIPVWAFQVILPVAFLAIALRYLAALLHDLVRLFGAGEDPFAEAEAPP